MPEVGREVGMGWVESRGVKVGRVDKLGRIRDRFVGFMLSSFKRAISDDDS